MKIQNGDVIFNECDMNFVSKLGLIEATEMVLDFKSQYKLPFIFDTYQLADFLSVGRKKLFEVTKNSNDMYMKTRIPKRSGGTRELSVPNLSLKHIQKKINRYLLRHVPISKYATAYYKGAKLKNNAQVHTGKKYLLKMDLSDFFSNIRFGMVYSSAFNTRYFPKQIGTMLTTLCCKDDVLPQGAPTSPALSNIVMKFFDDNFGAWCENRGFSYTRYCDDITVSGNTSLYPAYQKAKGWLENMGFEINERKTHFITNANRQTVTGLTVNEKVSVTSDYKRKLRQEIYYALKYGLENAVIHENLSKYIYDETVDTYRYYCYLIGKIKFVLSIEKDNEYFKNAVCKLKDMI